MIPAISLHALRSASRRLVRSILTSSEVRRNARSFEYSVLSSGSNPNMSRLLSSSLARASDFSTVFRKLSNLFSEAVFSCSIQAANTAFLYRTGVTTTPTSDNSLKSAYDRETKPSETRPETTRL